MYLLCRDNSLIWSGGNNIFFLFIFQPKAVRIYELSVDCYRYRHLWVEATKVLVTALSIGSQAVPSAVGWWSKVKRDAVAKGEEFFTEM